MGKKLVNKNSGVASVNLFDYSRIDLFPNQVYSLGDISDTEIKYYEQMNSVGLVLEDDSLSTDVDSSISDKLGAERKDLLEEIDKRGIKVGDIDSLSNKQIEEILK